MGALRSLKLDQVLPIKRAGKMQKVIIYVDSSKKKFFFIQYFLVLGMLQYDD